MAEVYADDRESRWSFHYTKDPLVRYLRDRRLGLALELLRRHGGLDPARQSVLLVCGGVGGEGTFLRDAGFRDVTVSDLSEEALRLCRRFDPRLATRLLNAEDMADVAEDAYDLVVVQDGLHHLPRPVLGFTEMLRVARQAVIVIEPHHGLVGSMIGTEWERHGDAVNYVFRWTGALLEQATRSYLLRSDAVVVAHRVWDHNLVVGRTVGRLPAPIRLPAAKAAYGLLTPLRRAGNMLVGVVLKPDGASPPRLAAH
jgi:SAM-dependent methyltransferase